MAFVGVVVMSCGDSLSPPAEDAAVADPPDTPAGPTGDRDPTGFGDSVFADGFDATNPFFAELGTNGRTCATCHVQAAGWTITPAHAQARFDATGGTDPLFRQVDGATSPNADVSTPAARADAFSMLLHRAVIRVGRPIPADAEFTLAAVDDPYGFASAAELSLFRRPLPSTNLRFLTAMMWDGRESSLEQQATDATLGHAEATEIGASQVSAIVAFERSISTAQTFDDRAGALDADGATGGVASLAATTFTPGENDPFSTGFDRTVFDLYAPWFAQLGPDGDDQTQRRAAIARGERIFNNRPIPIAGVAGINAPGQPPIQGTCSTCHNATSAGNHSLVRFVDLGLTNRRAPDQPLYTLRQISDGATRQTTDPGLALSTGKWDDIGKFKVPALRALVMRAPYFHDGSARDLAAVVGFYDQRFRLRMNPGERADLVAFLQSL